MIRKSEFNLSAYAEQVSKMTDEELSAEGQEMRKLVYPERISGTGPSSFEPRLEICRQEWKRRRSQKRSPNSGSFNSFLPSLPRRNELTIRLILALGERR